MKFESGVLTLVFLAGLSIVTPYGLYGGIIAPSVTIREPIAASAGRSFAGSAAGGTQPESPARDCRSCAKTSGPVPAP